jgi:hypothetical protein
MTSDKIADVRLPKEGLGVVLVEEEPGGTGIG